VKANAQALAGKVVLVTGAARSIGAEMSDAFEREGAIVIRTDIDDSAKDVRHLDVTDRAEWKTVVADVVGRHGRVDGLVNNAAVIFMAGPFWDETDEQFARMLDVNVMGTWHGLQVVTRAMAKTGGGSIVNFSSTSGMMAAAPFTGYGATRWAVRGLTMHVAMGMAPKKIRVNSLHPHGIAGSAMVEMFTPEGPKREVERFRKQQAKTNPLGRLGTYDDVSAMVTFLLSDQSTWITGREFVVDGGATLATSQ
jgi:3alpha(or 20beta)-hydroxysteroid dehydrogenase